MKPTAKKQSAKPDAELRRVLKAWDDTEADALNASNARLDALGPDAYEQLAALLRRRIRLCRRALWFACFNIILLTFFFVGWSTQHNSREPLPFVLGCVLGALIANIYISFLTALGVVSGKLPLQAAKAIAEQATGRYVGVLAELGCATGPFNAAVDGVSKSALLKAIDTLLADATSSDRQFTAYQQRCLHRLLLSPHTGTDLTCTVLRLLTHLEDRDALPRVRRLMAKSRNWEIQEAAQDYLTRFAPVKAANDPESGTAWERERQITLSDNSAANPVLACVMQLGSRQEAERRAAEAAIHQMGPEQIGQVLLLLGQEPAAEQRVGRAIVGISMLLTSLINALWFPATIRLPSFDAHMASIVTIAMMAAGLPLGWIVGLEVTLRRRNRRRARQMRCRIGVFPEKRLVETLVTLDNPALVGTLVDSLPGATAEMSSLTYSGANRVMRAALTHLLPCLQASDAPLLNAAQRARLNYELARGRLALNAEWGDARRADPQAALDVAILKAWEQIGDEHALPVVQKLAAQTARTPAQKRVQQAAQSCLPYLEVRAGEQRAVQTLLRAAETPTDSGNILLRAAASGTTQTDSAQLLRANVNTEE